MHNAGASDSAKNSASDANRDTTPKLPLRVAWRLQLSPLR